MQKYKAMLVLLNNLRTRSKETLVTKVRDMDSMERQEKNITHMINMMVLAEVTRFTREQMMRKWYTERRVTRQSVLKMVRIKKFKRDHQEKEETTEITEVPEEVVIEEVEVVTKVVIETMPVTTNKKKERPRKILQMFKLRLLVTLRKNQLMRETLTEEERRKIQLLRKKNQQVLLLKNSEHRTNLSRLT